MVLEFESVAEFELALDSLENRRAGIELLSVTPSFPSAAGADTQRARVYVPDNQVKYFLKKIEAYAKPTSSARVANRTRSAGPCSSHERA